MVCVWLAAGQLCPTPQLLMARKPRVSASAAASSSLPRVAIVSGLRTPFARQATAFKDVSALQLGTLVSAELVARTGLDPALINRVVFGQVLPSIEAPNIAREVVLAAGFPRNIDAYSVSRACATSFQAATDIAAAIQVGEIEVGLAGGADSTSVVPITVSKKLASTLLDLSRAKTVGDRLRLLSTLRPKDFAPVPPAVREFSTGLTMGESAEQMARDHGISREAQDDLAWKSHVRAAAAWEAGDLTDEVMSVHLPPWKQSFAQDNNLRPAADASGYAKLKPAFDKKWGTVTAGNASPLTDGAAALLLMREDRAKALGLTPLGYLRSWAYAALDPRRDLLMGPAHASPIAMERAGLTLDDLTLIDMHEAFAAQVLCNLEAFKSTSFARDVLGRDQALGEVDPEKFNVQGGSIAFGHPFAATGARMITQTLRALRRRGGGTALLSACAAGGLGAAMVLEVTE